MPATFYVTAFIIGLVFGYLAAKFDNYQPIPAALGLVIGLITAYQMIIILPVGIVFPVMFWTTIVTCVGVALSYAITTKPKS